jgi:hypothetical protein
MFFIRSSLGFLVVGGPEYPIPGRIPILPLPVFITLRKTNWLGPLAIVLRPGFAVSLQR